MRQSRALKVEINYLQISKICQIGRKLFGFQVFKFQNNIHAKAKTMIRTDGRIVDCTALEFLYDRIF